MSSILCSFPTNKVQRSNAPAAAAGVAPCPPQFISMRQIVGEAAELSGLAVERRAHPLHRKLESRYLNQTDQPNRPPDSADPIGSHQTFQHPPVKPLLQSVMPGNLQHDRAQPDQRQHRQSQPSRHTLPPGRSQEKQTDRSNEFPQHERSHDHTRQRGVSPMKRRPVLRRNPTE